MKYCILDFKTQKQQLLLQKSQPSVFIIMLKYINIYVFETWKCIQNFSGEDLLADVDGLHIWCSAASSEIV